MKTIPLKFDIDDIEAIAGTEVYIQINNNDPLYQELYGEYAGKRGIIVAVYLTIKLQLPFAIVSLEKSQKNKAFPINFLFTLDENEKIVKEQLQMKQLELLFQIQSMGLNMVDCGNCGLSFIHEQTESNLQCPNCFYEDDISSFPDSFIAFNGAVQSLRNFNKKQ